MRQVNQSIFKAAIVYALALFSLTTQLSAYIDRDRSLGRYGHDRYDRDRYDRYDRFDRHTRYEVGLPVGIGVEGLGLTINYPYYDNYPWVYYTPGYYYYPYPYYSEEYLRPYDNPAYDGYNYFYYPDTNSIYYDGG